MKVRFSLREENRVSSDDENESEMKNSEIQGEPIAVTKVKEKISKKLKKQIQTNGSKNQETENRFKNSNIDNEKITTQKESQRRSGRIRNERFKNIDHNDQSNLDSEEEPVTSGSEYDPNSEKGSGSEEESSTCKEIDSEDKNKSDSFIKRKAAINEEDLTVECVKAVHNEGDILTKQTFCYFCKTLQTAFVRHLETVHRNLDEIKELKAYPKNSKERDRLIAKLRGKGNFLHNTQAEYNTGKLIVARRPPFGKNEKAIHYTACVNCKQFFSKTNIRHHVARCNDKKKFKGREHMMQSKRMQKRCHPEASKIVMEKLLPVMRDDDIYRLVRFDSLIIAYANKMCKKYKLIYQHDLIRSKLRYLGKLLMIIQKTKSEIEELSQIYNPKYYAATTNACNKLAGFDEDSGEYKSPAVALNLGTLVKHVGEVHITKCIIDGKKDAKRDAEEFLHVFKSEYSVDVNKVANEQMQQAKRQKKVTLPSVGDISKLWKFLKDKRDQAYLKLEEEYSSENWKELMNYTLISIQVFNRRRAGETERILIDDFQARQSIDAKVDPEVYKRLSKKEREYAEKYSRFVVRGKLNRTVAVILQKELVDCCLAIIKYRKEAKVPDTNKYLFGLPSMDKSRPKYLRACGLLRKYSTECGADVPYTLRGTQLRKHVATTCLKMDLTEQFTSDLANFMGHADNIHKAHYRMPVAHKEILGITKLLEVAQGCDEEDNSDDDEENPLNQDLSQDLSQEVFEENDDEERPRKNKKSLSEFSLKLHICVNNFN